MRVELNIMIRSLYYNVYDYEWSWRRLHAYRRRAFWPAWWSRSVECFRTKSQQSLQVSASNLFHTVSTVLHFPFICRYAWSSGFIFWGATMPHFRPSPVGALSSLGGLPKRGAMARTVVLEGGTPWGFRLQGGREFNEHIRISKVRLWLYQTAQSGSE